MFFLVISYRNALTVVFGRYSEFRNIPSCRFIPVSGADQIRRAGLLNSEYSCQRIWPQQ